MADKIGPKLHLAGVDFSIQRMRRTGFTKMPRPHSHTSYELYYVLAGERVYFMNGGVYTARKGDLVVVLPGDLHSTASSEVPEFERVLINFTSHFIQDALPWLEGVFPFETSTVVRFPLKEQAGVEALLVQMVEECREAGDFNETVVRAQLLELLVRIRRAMRQESRADEDAAKHPMHAKITEIGSYIHDRYAEPITLEDTAQRFFISPSYLSRIFLKLTGFHFREYVQVVRIREAERRLRSTKDKVQTIAEQCGFERIEHFNRIFKKLNGHTPLQYRKLH
ncbi:AraC family transcriptional regulator [Paenibacillus sp. TRM 82003]|nr:AraC family transcriptional regulator [Paenibacillus sp. TRM 82003]